MMHKKRVVVSPQQFDIISRTMLELSDRAPDEAARQALLMAGVGLTQLDELPLEVELIIDWESDRSPAG